MPFVLLSVSAVGLGFLIFCIYMLVAPFVGWKHVYDASTVQASVNVPKAGRFSFSIRRDRFWLWKGYGTLSNARPKVDFAITKLSTGETITYVPALRMSSASTGRRTVTVRVGYFDAPGPGNYLITSQPESQFIQKDEIVIRGYTSTARLVLSIVGTVISAQLFLFGLIFGLLLLTGII